MPHTQTESINRYSKWPYTSGNNTDQQTIDFPSADEEKKTTKERFADFHAANPHVYEWFKKFAFQLINAKPTTGTYKVAIGSKQIIERVRFEAAITTTDQDFKINNNYTPYYSRLFAADFPHHADKFKYRNVKSK